MTTMTKRPAKERVEQRITNMVLRHPFFSTCILNLAVRPEPCGTACTDGTVLLWDPAFIDGLEDPEVSGLLAHEIMHCVLLHPFRMDETYHDPLLSNVAMDFEINGFLDVYNKEFVKNNPNTEAPFPLPQGALIDHQYDGMAWEQIYEKLLKDGKGPGGQPPPGGQPGSNPATDGSWGKVESPGQGSCKPKGKDGKQTDGHGNPVDQKTMGDWQGGIVPKAEAVAKMQGNMPGAFGSMLDKLRRPEIPWHERLARYFDERSDDDYDMRRPDRRYTGADIYLPTLYGETMGALAVGDDCSGSIYHDVTLHERFYGELNDIIGRVRPTKTTVIQFDTRVTKVNEYRAGDSLDREIKGGGGTDFRPVFDHIEKEGLNPRVLVMLTDGYGDWPSEPPPYDVIAVDYGNNPHYPDWMEVIRTKPA